MIIKFTKEYTRKNIKLFTKLYRKMYEDNYSSDLKIKSYIENDVDELFEILVYIENNKMVGCVYIEKTDVFAEKEYEDDIFYISNLYVLEDYRRMGIANKLLKKVEEIAIENGIKIIASDYNISNKTSAIVHKNNGFIEVSKVVQVIKNIEK